VDADFDASFALCLTHDVDRPYKTYQAPYEAVRERSLQPLRALSPRVNPYWQFDDILSLEDELGVRSAFYVLNEPSLFRQPPREWLEPAHWIEHLGRYDVTADDIRTLIRRLAAGGWEVGLHGSYHSPGDPERLAREKRVLESLTDQPVVGGRQHHLRLGPNSWRHHQDIGLRYDASLGSSRSYGFTWGYRPRRPFDDEFVVFPLTAMEIALPDPGERFADAWAACEGLLAEADANDAVMSVLWHPRYFSETEFPGYRRLYRRLVERALDMGAWVGPPRDLYERLDLDRGTEPLASEPTAVEGFDHGISPRE
jgi:peptidoglycan/xylan/chitin deacetylase (PgdA/CDA1 family)